MRTDLQPKPRISRTFTRYCTVIPRFSSCVFLSVTLKQTMHRILPSYKTVTIQ